MGCDECGAVTIVKKMHKEQSFCEACTWIQQGLHSCTQRKATHQTAGASKPSFCRSVSDKAWVGLQTSDALSPSSSSGSMAAAARSSGACCLLELPAELPVMDSGPLIDRSSLLWPVKACPLALLQIVKHTVRIQMRSVKHEMRSVKHNIDEVCLARHR